MKVLILEDRGIYKKGREVEMDRPKGQQWINSGFAELVPEKQAKPVAATSTGATNYADYSSKELSEFLNARDLPVDGNKANKIARLEEDDTGEGEKEE